MRFRSTALGLGRAALAGLLEIRHVLECRMVRWGLDGAIEKRVRRRIRKLERARFSTFVMIRLDYALDLAARVFEHRGEFGLARATILFHARHPYFFYPETILLRAAERLTRGGPRDLLEEYVGLAKSAAEGSAWREESVQLWLDAAVRESE